MAMTKYEPLPQRYEYLVDSEKYIQILDLCNDYLNELGVITKISDGIIQFDDKTGEYQNFSLDNLIRTLAPEDRGKWKSIVYEHFDKLYKNSEKEYNLDDFDVIKGLLGIRVYPDGYFESVNFIDKIIYRVDFENTKSTIVLDFPEKFQPVEKDYLAKWKISENELFNIALKNVSKQEIEITKQTHDGGYEVY